MARKNHAGKEPPSRLPTPTGAAQLSEAIAEIKGFDVEFQALLDTVGRTHRERYLAIVERTDWYCANHLQPLHGEYALYCRVMAAALCGKRSPVVEGKASPQGWAAAIVAALGFVNFLSDPDFPPVKTIAEVAAGFGVSESSMQAKSRQIRKLLGLGQFDPEWTLPSLMMRNPLVWMLESPSGMIVDIRSRPRSEQVLAFEAGLIPFVPADEAGGDDESASTQIVVKSDQAEGVVGSIGHSGARAKPSLPDPTSQSDLWNA
ncbi:MAG: DUF6398 domain-containing protein [Phycisphaerales bacterium]|nr:DUF6398 domain-containing protein [Phycisphaerales bacterium]